MSDLCLKNDVDRVSSALVPSRGLHVCRVFAERTRHTQCVGRLFLRVARIGCLQKRTMCIQCVARLFLCVADVGSLLKER